MHQKQIASQITNKSSNGLHVIVQSGVCIQPLPVSLTGYLFSGEQGDGRHTVGVLVAFSYSHLFEEIHLLLAGEKEDFGVAKHHDGVRQLVAKQPCLRGKASATVNI